MSAMSVKSILIGSNGYLGRHLAWQLEKDGFNNSCYDIHQEAASGIRDYHQFDVTDKSDFSRLDSDIDYIFLFAGLTGTADGFDNFQKFIEVNEVGLLNLLEWMRESGCKARIIYPSTRLVYKGKEGVALKEDDSLEAKTIYAANKLNAEKLLWMYQNAFDIDYTVFRICVPYGNLLDGDLSYGTLGFFLRQAEAGKDITLFGDGQIRRTFSHVADISALITKSSVLDGTKNEIYNIGGEDLSLLDAASLVAHKFGVGVSFTEWPEMAERLESGSTVFDDSKLLSTIPFQYRYQLGTWLDGLVEQ